MTIIEVRGHEKGSIDRHVSLPVFTGKDPTDTALLQLINAKEDLAEDTKGTSGSDRAH